MEVGCSSLGSFSTLFAARVGESPSAYRRGVRPLIQVPEMRTRLMPGCFSLMAFLPASSPVFGRATRESTRGI
jgi:hypothetical protein